MNYAEAVKLIEIWCSFIHGYMNEHPEKFTIQDHEKLEQALKIVRDGN
jgi:NADH:ubiquinone oxidoreductase subunit